MSVTHKTVLFCFSQITRAISGGEEMFDSLIFSDQYVGPKQPDDE